MIIAEMETRVPTLSVSDADADGTGRQPAAGLPQRKHGGVNVIHRRDDGNVGWIDPRNMGWD